MQTILTIPIINKTISASITIFNTPTHAILGITNTVITKNPTKLFTVFLEYDGVTKQQLLKDLKKLARIIDYKKAFVIRSRPNENNRWHAIIPEVFTTGGWLETLAESKCDDSYKSMSIKRGYSVLRISKKAGIGAPQYAFTYTNQNNKTKRFISAWHAKYLEKAYGLKIKGKKLDCDTAIIHYHTGHFD